ncbi:hypothetical protein BD410DRAFT_837750 [Rickenella mellea]|uniref:Uncharacterized protein n=1 Tax=Rickenella mellea TaxID=50990 RepID=A0A4Y7QBS7_9AGAM|nr:hypothetical protein BD410DRAFT_837750 [Rickenella mellea]
MESWPADYRNGSHAPSFTRGKRKAKENANHWHYPVLDYGALTAATLGPDFEWKFINDRCRGARVQETGKHTKIFPATRALPPPPSKLTSKRKAEQGAQFLRTHYPDIDIPFELINEELIANEKFTADKQAFDPFVGNTIESMHCPDGPRKRCVMLAFPMGENAERLNISPFLSGKDYMTFQPTAKPSWSFQSPIQQIISSSPAMNPTQQKILHVLAIRTFNQVTLLDIKNNPSSKSKQQSACPVTVSKIFSIESSDTDNSPIMDMHFSPPTASKSPILWLVNELGSVFQCNPGAGRKIVTRLVEPSLGDSSGKFFRLAAGAQEHDCIVASEKSIKLYDVRAMDSNVPAYVIGNKKDFVTSVESSQDNHIFCASTTAELLWLDNRNLNRPIMGWRHHRSFDRTLRVRTVVMGGTSLSLLSTRKNGLISAYGVSKANNEPLRAILGPSALGPLHPTGIVTSSTFIKHSDSSLSLVGLSPEGNLRSTDVRYFSNQEESSEDHVSGVRGILHEWLEEVEDLEKRSAMLRPDIGKLGEREFKEVDMLPLYERLFKKPEVSEDDAKRLTEEVFDILDNMTSSLRGPEIEADYLRTTFDIASSSGDDPAEPSRSDFLTGTALNSPSGYRAYKDGRIPVKELAAKAAWHLHLPPIWNRITPDLPASIPSDPQELLPYTLDSGTSPRPHLALQRESEALDELALDLALSADIYSASPFIKSKQQVADAAAGDDPFEASTMLSQAAEGLSLRTTEPPPVDFGYFQPVRKDAKGGRKRYKDHDEVEAPSDAEEEAVDMPMGVRLLLSEWDVGSNPDEYQYVDPYDAEESHAGIGQSGTRNPRVPRVPEHSVAGQSTIPPQPHQPPLVIPASSLKPPAPSKPPKIQSQRLTSGSQPLASPQGFQFSHGASQPDPHHPPDSSQDFMTSTQVLPGPFGGRQPVGKKKPAKKRVVGF